VISKRVLILDNDPAQVPRLKDCFARFHHGCVSTMWSPRPQPLRLGLFAYVPKQVDFAPFEHIVAMACGST
jgi:hypothetical protein